MASVISASTTSNTALNMTADTTGVLQLATGATPTTAVTIDTSQNVGIGTTSPVFASGGGLSIYNATAARIKLGDSTSGIGSLDGVELIYDDDAYLFNRENTALIFGTNNAERMRIASNGYVGIGTTNASNPLAVRNNTTSAELGLFENTASSGNPKGILSAFGSNGNNTSSFHYAGLTQGVSFWYLYGNGTSSWTSDERKKKNIETTRDGYIDDLCKLRVVKYNWKLDEDNKPKELGLIAQEVEQIFPGLIQDALHEDNDGVKYKTIKGSVLPYMLLKAIQEQQTIINDLKARIETLEAK